MEKYSIENVKKRYFSEMAEFLGGILIQVGPVQQQEKAWYLNNHRKLGSVILNLSWCVLVVFATNQHLGIDVLKTAKYFLLSKKVLGIFMYTTYHSLILVPKAAKNPIK